MARLAAAASSVVARRIVVEFMEHRNTDRMTVGANLQTDGSREGVFVIRAELDSREVREAISRNFERTPEWS